MSNTARHIEQFTAIKCHCLRNDFLLCSQAPPTTEIIRICDRKAGFGADGVISYQQIEKNNFAVQVFNSDGSEAGLCGNGFACLALFLHKQPEFTNPIFYFQASGGCFNLEVRQSTVKLQIPSFEMIKNRYLFPHEVAKTPYYLIDVGNEHAVFFDKPEHFGVESYFADKVLFPNSINISLARQIKPSEFGLEVIERGCGLTEACTSGALSVGILAHETLNCQLPVTIRQRGGVCTVDKNYDNYFVVLKPEIIGKVYYEYKKQ